MVYPRIRPPFRNDESTANKWSVDPIQVPIRLVTKARDKRFKETLNVLIQCNWAEKSSWRSKRDVKSVLQDWVSMIQAMEWESLAEDQRIANLVDSVDRIPNIWSTFLSRYSAPQLQFSAPQYQMSLISFLFRVRMISNIPISFLGLSECIFSLFNYLFYPF